MTMEYDHIILLIDLMENHTIFGSLNWPIFIAGYIIIYIVWSWVPVERLDRYWRWNNRLGRPVLNTIVLTGLPALYAKMTHTPIPYILILITFLSTQYAVLTGRFLLREFNIAGWVMVLTTVLIWVLFFLN